MATFNPCQTEIHSQASQVGMSDSEFVTFKNYQVLFFLLPGTAHSARQKPEEINTIVGNKFPLPNRSSSNPLDRHSRPAVYTLTLFCLLCSLASSCSSKWLLNKFACEIETKQKALRPGEHQRSLSNQVKGPSKTPSWSVPTQPWACCLAIYYFGRKNLMAPN